MIRRLLLALIVILAAGTVQAQQDARFRFLVRLLDGNLYIVSYDFNPITAERIDIGEYVVTAVITEEGLAVVYDDEIGQHLAIYTMDGTLIRPVIDTPTTSETGFTEWKHLDYANGVLVASIDVGSNAGGIYSIDLTQTDNAELNYITQGLNPTLSPQADYIAYETFISYPNNLDMPIPVSSIAIHQLQTGVQTVITSELQRSCRHPLWHPSEMLVVYFCWNESNEIWGYQTDITTWETRRLPLVNLGTCMVWSPNAAYIALFGESQIHIYDVPFGTVSEIPLPDVYQGMRCLDWIP